MRQSEKFSIDPKHSTVAAQTTDKRITSKKDFATKICKVENYVYLCIGKRTEQSTQDISKPHYSGVLGAVPFFGSVRLPKHKRASLFLYTYNN